MANSKTTIGGERVLLLRRTISAKPIIVLSKGTDAGYTEMNFSFNYLKIKNKKS